MQATKYRFPGCVSHAEAKASSPMNVHHTYAAEKAAWMAAHPGATPEQIETACRQIAERLGV